MNRQEVLALCGVFLILVVFPVAVFAYRRESLQASGPGVRVIDLLARAPEAGGWYPEVIAVNKGDRVRLRITGQDVVHGFVVGRLGIDAGRILPGETAVVEFVADRIGRFTYYCNAWCSPSHYRMRGTLEVRDPLVPDELLISDVEPVSGLEGVDIDAPHEAQRYPVARPSAVRGSVTYRRLFGPDLPSAEELEKLRVQSPSDVFLSIEEGRFPGEVLGSEVAPTTQEIWDIVSYFWSLTTTPEKLAVGQALYGKNCAACHGETGAGDGPGGRHLEVPPVDFTQARTTAGGTGALYEAKMKRGGMGTGMPYWGAIFTAEEQRSLVDYLWTFLFSYLDE